MKKFFYLSIILLTQVVYAQRGTISGTVVDKNTNEPLPSVNVVVKGTYYGAASDFEGKFTIPNVTPGSYTVEVTLIGYKTVQYTGVKVNPGETTTLNVKMEETVLSVGQEVVVIGERPLFNIEETASRRSITSEDIQLAVVKDVRDVVSLQAGVVSSDNEIYIRGGRSYENAYLIDGISVQDPLAGQGFGLQIAPQAIAEMEVITGGYNAEYGQATSGVVNITTKEGTKSYSGSIGYKRDHFWFNKNSLTNANTDIYEFNLSGPGFLGGEYLFSTLSFGKIPLEELKKISFFINFYANITDGYTRWVENIVGGKPAGYKLLAPKGLYSSIFNGRKFAPKRSNSYSFLGKLTYRPSSTIKLSYAFSQSVQIDQNSQTIQATLDRVEPNPGYQFLFQNIPDSANTFTQVNQQNSLSWTHTLNTKTFYELKLSYYTAHVRGDANGKSWDQYFQPKDIVTFPVEYFFPNPNSYDTIYVIPGDGFYDYGSPSTWRDHQLNEFTFKFDLTSNITEKNKFKSGLEMRFQEMQLIDIFQPWVRPLGFDNDIFKVYPAFGAVYAQNSLTMSGMILNYGLRLDYWLPGKYVDDAVEKGTAILVPIGLLEKYKEDSYKWFGRYWKARISPRLGISHPVTDNQTLFFSYGHFSKLPRPQFIYSKLGGSRSRSSFQTIGNPNLNPETTVAYELGLRNQITENDVLTITAFYKDIFDYITAKQFRAIISGTTRGLYTIYINQDYARVRGIEIEYKTRISKLLRINISGSYSIATGKSSSANENVFNIQQGLEENLKENYVIWDRPLQLSTNINLYVPKNKPLFDFAQGILDDYNVYVRIFYQSGKRYTPQIFYRYNPTTGRPEYRSDRDNPYSKIGQDWFYIDLNFEKYFDIKIGKLVFSFEVQNLLDRKNSQILNPVTGKAYEYGQPTPVDWNDPLYPDITAPIDPFPYNPARYLNPRTYKFGLSFRF